MRQRLLAVFILVLSVCVVASPVFAGDFAGEEADRKTVRCPKKGESVPENQSPPKGKDCKGGKKKYKAWVWDNDVKCAATPADAGVIRVYATGDPMSGGGVGICNDTAPVPIQGRATASGSTSEGLTVYADGDRDNANEQLQGWAKVHVNSSGPSVTCGDAEGKRDVNEAGPKDGQDDCG